jgi:hypothetical protein
MQKGEGNPPRPFRLFGSRDFERGGVSVGIGIDDLGTAVHKYTDWYTDFSITDSVLMSIWKRVTEAFIIWICAS